VCSFRFSAATSLCSLRRSLLPPPQPGCPSTSAASTCFTDTFCTPKRADASGFCERTLSPFSIEGFQVGGWRVDQSHLLRFQVPGTLFVCPSKPTLRVSMKTVPSCLEPFIWTLKSASISAAAICSTDTICTPKKAYALRYCQFPLLHLPSA
jgi:hypothetical protein